MTKDKSEMKEKGPRITEIVTPRPDDKINIRRTKQTNEADSEPTPGTSKQSDPWINGKTNEPHSQDEWDQVTTELVTLSNKARSDKQHVSGPTKRTRKRKKGGQASSKKKPPNLQK